MFRVVGRHLNRYLPGILIFVVLTAVLAPGALRAHADLIERIKHLDTAIAKRPDYPALYLQRAGLHRRHRDWGAAFADISQARRLAPNSPAADYAEAVVWFDKGDPAKAKVFADRLLDRKPDHVGGLLLRARVHKKSTDFVGAANDLDRAIAHMTAPSPDVYLERSRALREVGPAAVERLLAGLAAGVDRLGPVVALVALAIDVEAARGRPEAALRWLQRLPDKLQALATWQARRGDLLLAAGRREAALDAYRTALAQIRSLTPHRRQSRTNQALETRLQVLVTSLR